MSAKDLRGKEPRDLQAEVIKLRREQFSLRMQAASGQTVKSSDFGKVKKSIARVKTVMREQALKKTGLTAAAGAKK
jgi:large subunit ribosomal protein L29